ncbi:MAG: polysulfide reductase NrfD [Proteobacteria bacterium]|nr:polysulfide reductase NrfD [Pseudomonadota bacterium]MBU1389161.1 polysulfide reductase NrfD [Pseudomonadota bacterium]MBU1543385.1 polysulfide reductase NrfD [Pseudomonadota bacterium]MBU2482487.1 polysulfide reductase NrfD [Pseudomonadota bacterium]
MDSALIPEGVKRTSFPKFFLGMAVVGAVVLWGLIAVVLIWWKGLNQTNMNDYYGFALWIWADLAVIAVGGGAFFTGLLKYIFKVDELKNIINFAVIIGVICYSSALFILAIDVGQPLRSWFIFWHANVHSMLTEVAFCLSCYFAVLVIEFIPNVLENRQLNKVSFFHHLAHNMHGVMAVFAATGAFLSFFHQGSLGGVAGVMYGRPFAFREGLLIWPWTFFLFTWSAAAFGPCFTLLVTKITEAVTGKKLVSDKTVHLLAKISGWMITTYIIAKIIDTIYWATVTVPASGFTFSHFFSNNAFYGYWILFAEIVLCGVVPGLLLIYKPTRENSNLRLLAIILGVIGVCLNRWVMVLQVMAVPVMSFDTWALYIPSWQEVATTILPVAYGIMFIALAYRYLPVFPQEKELNYPAQPVVEGE